MRSFQPTGRSEDLDLDIREQSAGLYLLRYADDSGVRWEEKVSKE